MGQAGRPRKPLAMQKGHLTNAQKAEMRAREEALRCPIIEFDAPDYLESAPERARFGQLADLLQSVDEQLCTALDADQLARYVVSESLYKSTTKRLRAAMKGGDVDAVTKVQRQQNTAFQQVQACASALGLNVTSRLKIDLRHPERDDDDDFSKFE